MTVKEFARQTRKTLLLLFGPSGGATPVPVGLPGLDGGMPYSETVPRVFRWCAYGAEGLRGHAEVSRSRAPKPPTDDELVALAILTLLD